MTTINAGGFYELSSAGDSLIETSEPVLVAQYLKGWKATGYTNEYGDPAMTFIPGIEQALDSYVFAAPTGGTSSYENYLNIAIPTSALASLTLNGSPVDTSGFTALASTSYSTGNIKVAAGTGKIEADTPFTLTISGFSQAESYLSFIATTYSYGASPKPVAAGTVQAIPSLSWLALAVTALGFIGLTRRRVNQSC